VAPRRRPVIRKTPRFPRADKSPRGKGPKARETVVLGLCLLGLLVSTGVFVYYYVRFSRIIDARLSGEVFDNASLIFSAPVEIRTGQAITSDEVEVRLRRALYTEEKDGSEFGSYRRVGNQLEIRPGPASFLLAEGLSGGPTSLLFRNGRVTSITTGGGTAPVSQCWLEPEVITTLFDRSRTKRRLVRYQDLPPVLVNAILATEDHRFFSHHGVNFLRIIAATIKGVRTDERIRGTSTLTMQLARNFFLTRERTLERKAAEIFLALLLEQRLSKDQIFELYANQIYLGQHGSFAVHGVGEAASVYFNKDVGSLALPEAALLAGIIRGPSFYSPYRHPDRAVEIRNVVLRRMREVGFITPAEAEKAATAPLGVTQQNVEANQAPFFVDMVKDRLLEQFTERDLISQSYRVYTTLDLDLQRIASEAVRTGTAEVDEQLSKRKSRKDAPPEPLQPQVALVVLDPHTGAIRALVGGRDYGASQLNHVLAKRQPGSSFKPFVYATALSSAVEGWQPLITPTTILVDEPTTFQYGEEPYEPENYKQEYHGPVTLREALAHSLNVASVRLAEMVGYDRVRRLAVAAGINQDLLPTPAIALGAYVATPLEIAGAYTIFANQGRYVAPSFIQKVADSSGKTLWRTQRVRREVLDPRVAYIMVSLLQSVINSGTGAGVRSRGFTLPAAGKTGTSHDGWFVGFTPRLLAAVWVGYDDDRELHLSGAYSALPVWTAFMKDAAEIPAYRNEKPFEAPVGVVTATIDTRTNLLASAESPYTRNEVFIEGTVPAAGGSRPGGVFGILGRIFRPGGVPTVPAAVTSPPLPLPEGAPPPGEGMSGQALPEAPEAQPAKKKGGVIRRFLSIFKGGQSDEEKKPAPSKDTKVQ
jgi:penicillin-binding protein 1B